MSVEEMPFKPRPRKEWLSFMAALSMRAGDMRKAEGYMLELLACCAFAVEEELGL